jgi:hypothetical protein
MEFEDLIDKPEIPQHDSLDRLALERKLSEAEPARPGTFRYSDQELGGEVRTSLAQEGGLYAVAQAEVFRRDGTSEVVGMARYSVAGGEATLEPSRFTAANFGVEQALLKEIGEQAQVQGANWLHVWLPDDDPGAAQRWQSLGFLPGERDPGAAGTHWGRPV